jgi:hypothetical protein
MAKLSGWQKAGLVAGVGCLTIVVVGVVGIAVAVMWARSTVAELGDTTPTRVERTIPVAAADAVPDRGVAAGADATPDEAAMRLEIDLEEGSFTIRPGKAGEPIRAEGTYSEALHELTEDRQTDASGRVRSMRIRFRSKAPVWARILAGMGESNQPNLTITIPEGVPIALTLRVAMGESRTDLGGLSLSDIGLDLAMGEHRIDFSEPVVGGAQRLRLNAGMGEVTITNIGNARPSSVAANASMGSLTADLGGAWAPKSTAEFSFTQSMGELRLNVPRDVRLETQYTESQDRPARTADPAGETADPDAPLLRLQITTSMGESRISRY